MDEGGNCSRRTFGATGECSQVRVRELPNPIVGGFCKSPLAGRKCRSHYGKMSGFERVCNDWDAENFHLQYFVGRMLRDGGSFDHDYIKVVNTVSAAASVSSSILQLVSSASNS